jgi:hypothetical protein
MHQTTDKSITGKSSKSKLASTNAQPSSKAKGSNIVFGKGKKKSTAIADASVNVNNLENPKWLKE